MAVSTAFGVGFGTEVGIVASTAGSRAVGTAIDTDVGTQVDIDAAVAVAWLSAQPSRLLSRYGGQMPWLKNSAVPWIICTL